jgi:hypothetical protein
MANINIVCAYCAIGHPPSFCLLEIDGGCLSKTTDEKVDSLESILYMASEVGEELSTERVYKDAVSTGRKRAADLYPISVGQVCAWAWSKKCGGGVEPITGCTGRPATNIHHGPDKSTFSNEASNISVICTFCHNRYHIANDKYYTEPRPENGASWLPNIPEGKELIPLSAMIRASKQEILMAEMLIPEGGKDRG